MKKILLPLACIISHGLSYSQITITNDQIIQPNSEVYRTILDTSGFSPGNAGSNVVWDFSSLNILQYNAEHFQYLPVSATDCFTDPEINTYLDGGMTFPAYRYIYYAADASQFG